MTKHFPNSDKYTIKLRKTPVKAHKHKMAEVLLRVTCTDRVSLNAYCTVCGKLEALPCNTKFRHISQLPRDANNLLPTVRIDSLLDSTIDLNRLEYRKLKEGLEINAEN